MSDEQIRKIREELEIQVFGKNIAKPILSFDHLIIDNQLKGKVLSMKYEKPTPIQCQALPCALNGRDIIGIAKTGSGKTLAYVIPMITHILDQRMLKRGEGPIGLVVAPTRELCQQIVSVMTKYASIFKIKVLSFFGNESKQEQWKMLLAGVEIIISTPGRLIDMIRKGAFSLSSRCTFVVVDEADIMFKMGFEYQIRMILGQVRPDRQMLLFSATFPKKIQSLVQDVLRNYVKIVVGKIGNPNEDVGQFVVVFEKPEEKLRWLLQNLPQFMQDGQILIFCNQIKSVEELSQDLTKMYPQGYIEILHGDKMQHERAMALYNFKTNKAKILISTNVASRGLDIPQIHCVINYEPAKDKDDHTHRIGRTGRAGDTSGIAYTLLMKSEYNKAGMLIEILKSVNQPIPEDLEKLAKADPKYRSHHVEIGIPSMHTTVDTYKEKQELNEKSKTSSYKMGLGYKRPEKGRKFGKFEETSGMSNEKNIFNNSDLQQMRINSMKFDEIVKLGPAGAYSKMQEQYASQMKAKSSAQLMQGFKAGGAIVDNKIRPTITYYSEELKDIVTKEAEPMPAEQPKINTQQNNEQPKKRRSLWDIGPSNSKPQ